MKRVRQNKILELIDEYDIDTQEELGKRLHESGFRVTQATISRDIKELQLKKQADNLVVIKTVSGMAMAVAAAIDALEIEEIVGSIAGDDTIMCAVRTADLVPAVIEKISNK